MCLKLEMSNHNSSKVFENMSVWFMKDSKDHTVVMLFCALLHFFQILWKLRHRYFQTFVWIVNSAYQSYISGCVSPENLQGYKSDSYHIQFKLMHIAIPVLGGAILKIIFLSIFIENLECSLLKIWCVSWFFCKIIGK